MARARGGEEPARAVPVRRQSPDEARILARLKRLAPQQRALALALRPFSDDTGRFDPRRWERAFASDDAEDIYHVFGVPAPIRRSSTILSMLHVGARIAGLDVARAQEKPSAPLLIDAVKDDKGLTANQAEVLKRLYRTRNDLQHASLDAQADDVYDDIVLLQKTLARFAKSYVQWLEGHGAQLLPRRS
jgi:FAD/FMN-containing dehydrogenase